MFQTFGEASIPFEDMKELVARYVCNKKVEKLGQALADEILGVE